MSLIVAILFFAFCILGIPLAFAFGAAGLTGFQLAHLPIEILASKMMFAINSFPLLAIPFFMLAGELMVKGGIVTLAIRAANTLVGRVHGGLGHVTIASGMGLASVSGTAVADAAALGSALMKPLSQTYSRPFGAALIAACGNLGPILPPSTAMIVYASIAGPGVSIPELFLGGVLPAILIAVSMSAYVSITSWARGYPLSGDPIRWQSIRRECGRALPVLLVPIVVIGGIVGGVFTATEGGAIAVVMASAIGLFYTRELKLSDFPSAMLNAGMTTGIVAIIIAAASTVTFIFSIDQMPNKLSTLIQSLTDNPQTFLLLVFGMLVLIGMFMESTAAYVMLVPIFSPIAAAYGVDPVHFALVFILTLIVGMLTPPVGTLLFVACGISGLRVGDIVGEVLPFTLIQLAVTLLVLFFPSVFLWLPQFAN